MRVVVTGASGFLGRRLTQALLAARGLVGRGGEPQLLTELILVDRVAVTPPRIADVPVHAMVGDLADPVFADQLGRTDFDSLFHLAATLTLEAEQDPARAFAINVDPLRRLVLAPRVDAPRIVFTSSIAVFGGALPERVDDGVRAAPTTTYGAHKAILELLLADATRQGRVDARALRLPIVVTRPGAPVPAISDRVAAILREPLAGRDLDCPFDPETRLCLASAGAVVRALLTLHDAPAGHLPPGRALNLPALSVTVAEMVAAVAAHRGSGPRGRVRYVPDPAVQAIVAGWPQHFVSAAGSALGLSADTDLPTLIADHLAHAGTDHAGR